MLQHLSVCYPTHDYYVQYNHPAAQFYSFIPLHFILIDFITSFLAVHFIGVLLLSCLVPPVNISLHGYPCMNVHMTIKQQQNKQTKNCKSYVGNLTRFLLL